MRSSSEILIGGYIGYNYLGAEQGILLSDATTDFLQSKGIRSAGSTYQPDELFSVAALQNGLSWTFLLLGGLLVGFWNQVCRRMYEWTCYQWTQQLAVTVFDCGHRIFHWRAHLHLADFT